MKKVHLKKAIIAVLASILALLIIFPAVWIILTSIKPYDDMFAIPVKFLPERICLAHYEMVLAMDNFRRYFFNSVIVSTISTVVNIVLAALAAFAFSRYQFRGSKILLGSVVLTQLFPAAVLLIPLYKLWAGLRLLDTYSSLVATYAIITLPLSIWMLTGFFNTIPKEVDEAALIDGCSRMQTLAKIILPLARPALFASATYIFINVWQEFLFSITFTTTDSMRTLPVGLYSFIGERATDWGPLMAGAVITTIPILLFFGFSQKNFTHGVAGAVKG